ncbi:unnamed protein product [Cuscuta europaea]|uniref:Peptidase A1 domain-containing protein n=1 Tax=Cuscuta europaea TaxID=41803 RepID=A0A9P1EPW2_CUSEU|nr:unnamed protein product [Cuscuta europaea]
MLPGRYLVVVAALYSGLLVSVVGVLGGGAMRFSLERAFPTSHRVGMDQLLERDRVRHGRMLQSSLGGVVDFPVEGTYDPFLVGLYFTRVQLGSPPKEFYVQIDTGSDVLWVSCNSCNGCPLSSGLQIQLEFFDPSSSPTSSVISCSDQRCGLGEQSSDTGCSTDNRCSYNFQYGDGSATSGYYVSDLIHVDAVVGNSLTSNTTAQVVFGCSTLQSGDLTKADRAVDGIFGFGQQSMSVISQLSSLGVTPNMFSHCLKGSDGGGGILVLGQIVEPSLVYTPLVPSQLHYNLNLESISIKGQPLTINPQVFSTSNNQGTIIDSGTTLAYLAEGAYYPFINAINKIVSASTQPLDSKGNLCYVITSSVSDIFPSISLNFRGGASMMLNPEDYLLKQNSIDGAAAWCIGFQKMQGQGITILGDLVLKDKIVVYDLENQRIGWTKYDCSMPVNVSTATRAGRSEVVDAGQLDDNSSLQTDPKTLILGAIIALLFDILLAFSFYSGL